MPTNTPSATQILPETYQNVETIDLFQQKKLAISLNLVGLLLFILAYWPMNWLIMRLRGLSTLQLFAADSTSQVIWVILGGIGFLVALIVLHEAAHGLFFRIYTGAMPKFALKLSYAYAAAPGWYIRRNIYMVVALAPILLISGLGLLLCTFVPASWLIPLILFICMNIASAVGDLYVFMRLLRLPASGYVMDEGDKMTFYAAVFKNLDLKQTP